MPQAPPCAPEMSQAPHRGPATTMRGTPPIACAPCPQCLVNRDRQAIGRARRFSCPYATRSRPQILLPGLDPDCVTCPKKTPAQGGR
ncbi:hypothetical protein FHS66_001172 [Pacificitalea manganoxidans]|nr:hypothetical protein [Pacificitalea manganoxidans]